MLHVVQKPAWPKDLMLISQMSEVVVQPIEAFAGVATIRDGAEEEIFVVSAMGSCMPSDVLWVLVALVALIALIRS